MNRLLIILPILIFTACTTHPHSDGRDRYIQAIEKHSAGDKQFAGVYENFEFRATILTTDVSRTVHERLSHIYDWSEEESQQKLDETMSELQEKTKIWLSFFTPDSKNDNLANKISIWKVYLHANGQRYEGRASKANKNFEEAKVLFPYHSRWATPYYVEFDVPTSQIETSSLKLVITGPLGRREVKFPTH